jgi:L-seryl-tRNA(Ser) seleniumtransferase
VTSRSNDPLRSIPSVSRVLEHDEVRAWMDALPRVIVVNAVQSTLQALRDEVRAGNHAVEPDLESVIARVEEAIIERSQPSLRRVINATGIILHTGLGRAPLADAALDAIADGSSGYCNLELDLATGDRGHRADHVARELIELTGSEAATVVNNNAAATLLILKTLAAGREVLVSRGELIEIGGSYRLPDIMTASGAVLREVGTTNRTRLSDYEAAVNERTAMILRVHPSNYRVIGFSESASLSELVDLGRRKHLPVVDDLGSGVLMDLSRFGLPHEPSVRESIEAGADLACFSGDKLLGGPQCGIIVGRRALIQRIEKDPLYRTYRVDKMTLLALVATLRLCADPDEAVKQIPTLAMLSASTDELAARASAIVRQLDGQLPRERFLVCSDVAYAGGGSLPTEQLPTVVVQWRPSRLSAAQAVRALRESDIPVVARIRDDAVCFDMRTVREPDVEPLVAAVTGVVWDDEPEPDDGRISLPVL